MRLAVDEGLEQQTIAMFPLRDKEKQWHDVVISHFVAVQLNCTEQYAVISHSV